ncbi:integral peroxisomal membrane peroxin-domain-containing protein [Xylogone sp. PMI_703]|nr:integral peroxisomal membrane peroxin-domain-containing protein [Xylogone sp. PMI_703]
MAPHRPKTMEDQTAGAIINREEPLPVINIGNAEEHNILEDNHDARDESPAPGKRERLKKTTSALKGHMPWNYGKDGGLSMQDRLLEKLLQQVIPDEDMNQNGRSSPLTTPYPDTFPERPSFNISTMSANFRRFNARIGVVFVFQEHVLRLFAWRKYTHTLSFLAVYTFICLDPYILTVLPFALLVLAVLIPSFMARHPAPPPTTLSTNDFIYSTTGPPIAPPPTVKPVKELSKDFFRNMRDLQNCMEDFSRVHDQILAVATPNTNFSNEPLSSTLFVFSFVTCIVMFIAAHLLPWRLIFLILGWALTLSGHPTIHAQMISTRDQHISPHEAEAKSWLDQWISADIILDSAPEIREVEIFELQRLSSAGDEWEPWMFSSSPYDPKEPSRVIGERPRGTRFFEDVQPPGGWEWSEKKWALDLWSREWVEERIITGVEVETEGERWVYDINYDEDDRFEVSSNDIDLDAADDPEATPQARPSGTNGAINKKDRILPSWEEGADSGVGRRGTWRRRRWVRTVKRKYINNTAPENKSS